MKIHFIGIGGISMSGLAHMCLCQGGYEVSGSDWSENPLTKKLQALGATIFIGQRAENITDDIDQVVYTAAIPPQNPELIAAYQKGIPTVTRSYFLGKLMKSYPTSIGVAGTHGKTSTTSMLSIIFTSANLNPTIFVGGYLKEIGGNMKAGGQEVVITEACEYADSFLDMYPSTAIVLNMEADHLDYFGSMDKIRQSFASFIQNVAPHGYRLLNGDDPELRLLPCTENTLFFGRNSDNDAVIIQESSLPTGGSSFYLNFRKEKLGPFSICIPGKHNVINAAAAALTSLLNGITLPQVQAGLEAYRGVGRRFEFKGKYKEIPVYDDYAHHPSEIKACLEACRQLNPSRLIIAFQPHTFTRTHFFLDDFASSFDGADAILVMDIFAAREVDQGLVHAKDLVRKLLENGYHAIYQPSFEEAKNWLTSNLSPSDLFFTIGAGDVYALGEKLINEA